MKCVICGEKIEHDIEEWVRLTDFSGNVQTGETYYHLECWRERFQITNSARKQKMYSQGMKAIQQIARKINGGGMVA